MSGLSGLGGFAGGLSQGFLSAEQVAQKRREQQLALQGADFAGQALLGNSPTGLPGQGAMPGNAPSPGQPSAPMQGPTQAGPPMQAAMPGASPMPGAQPLQGIPQGQPQAQGQPQQGYDLQTLITKIKQAHPNITGPQLMSAVGSLMPVLNLQGQQQYRQAMLQLGAVRAQTGQQNADTNAGRANVQADLGTQRLELAKQQLQLAAQKRDDANLKFEQNRNDTQAYREKVLADRAYEDATKAVQAVGNASPGSVDPSMAQSIGSQAARSMQQLPSSYAIPPQIKSVTTTPITAPPAQQPAPAADPNADIIQKAKDAIAKGAPRDAVAKRLKDIGVDPSVLGQ